jgi:hypothetical protein
MFVPLLLFSQENVGLRFQSTIYDFGELSSNEDATALFNFVNASGTPIEILNIKGGSRCVLIDSSSVKSFAPSEKGEIFITYNTACIGPIRKTLSVFTDYKDDTVSLKLTGKVSN